MCLYAAGTGNFAPRDGVRQGVDLGTSLVVTLWRHASSAGRGEPRGRPAPDHLPGWVALCRMQHPEGASTAKKLKIDRQDLRRRSE